MNIIVEMDVEVVCCLGCTYSCCERGALLLRRVFPADSSLSGKLDQSCEKGF